MGEYVLREEYDIILARFASEDHKPPNFVLEKMIKNEAERRKKERIEREIQQLVWELEALGSS